MDLHLLQSFMPHIHKLIDFVVEIFVIEKNRVLLVHHKQLKKWLPLGGHIELDEDPERAAMREAYEESGLKVKLIGPKPKLKSKGIKHLRTPRFLDIHRINSTHEHIGLVYFAKPLKGKVRLARKEHHDIKWFSKRDLKDPKYKIISSVRFYSETALKELK